jgi:gluconate 2-dehydrogenase alpha chain
MRAGCEKTDVVLVGLGAAGGIAARVLTTAGLQVVAVEAGPRRNRDEMTLDELRNERDHWLCAPKAAGEIPMVRSDTDSPSIQSPYPTLMANGVGGAALHYPGTSPRLFPWNFRMRSQTLQRYGERAVPADSMLVDWPLGYDELEPYYDLVEHDIGVCGQAGNTNGTSHAAGNPFEGRRSRDYPMPPLRRTGWTELMSAAARRLGWHPFPTPTAINSEPYNGNPACTYCGFCENNGCYNGAKGSPDNTVIPRADATGNLRVVTSARVTRVDVDRTGRVTGVTYVKDGRERFQGAAVVLLGAHTYENVRIMLLSASDSHPAGLANGRGQVGLGFMPHINPDVYGFFRGADLKLQTGSWGQGVCVDDWNGDNFDHSGLDFISGGMFTAAHELLKPIALSQTLPDGLPRWGPEWKAWIKQNARSVAVVNAQLDVLPYNRNFLDLDPVAKDPFGTPRVRVTYGVSEGDVLARGFLVEKLHGWLREAGAQETWSSHGPAIEMRTAYGGARMGNDPATSVVDRFGFAHEIPNLGLLGTCTFPTAGGHNPTLTLQALAWRTGQRLLEEWDVIAS